MGYVLLTCFVLDIIAFVFIKQPGMKIAMDVLGFTSADFIIDWSAFVFPGTKGITSFVISLFVFGIAGFIDHHMTVRDKAVALEEELEGLRQEIKRVKEDYGS